MRYLNLGSVHRRLPYILMSGSVLRYYMLHTFIVFFAAIAAGDVLMQKANGFVNPLLPETYWIVGKFIKWDAHWYTYVAQQGYNQMSIVFFPMLVMSIKAGASLIHLDYALAGFLICNVFCLTAFFLMHALFRLDFSAALTDRALLAFAVMPTSVFLNSVYTEPLFLTFCFACAFYTRTGRWWQAGLFAALATLTRNLGVFLVCFMAWEFWEQARGKKSKPAWMALSLLLPLFVLAGFVYYNYWLLGDPLAFVNAQKAWGREFGPPWIGIWRSMLFVWQGAGTAVLLDLLLSIMALVGLSTMTFRPASNIPRSYLIIGWIWLLVPLCSTTVSLPLYSLSRFVLVIFPLYIYIAQIRNRCFHILVAIGAAGTALASILFTNWYWLG